MKTTATRNIIIRPSRGTGPKTWAVTAAPLSGAQSYRVDECDTLRIAVQRARALSGVGEVYVRHAMFSQRLSWHRVTVPR